jgi:hypothetical protein
MPTVGPAQDEGAPQAAAGVPGPCRPRRAHRRQFGRPPVHARRRSTGASHRGRAQHRLPLARGGTGPDGAAHRQARGRIGRRLAPLTPSSTRNLLLGKNDFINIGCRVQTPGHHHRRRQPHRPRHHTDRSTTTSIPNDAPTCTRHPSRSPQSRVWLGANVTVTVIPGVTMETARSCELARASRGTSRRTPSSPASTPNPSARADSSPAQPTHGDAIAVTLIAGQFDAGRA